MDTNVAQIFLLKLTIWYSYTTYLIFKMISVKLSDSKFH